MKENFELPTIEVVPIEALAIVAAGPCCYDGHPCD